MPMYKISLVRGDGIGPELSEAAVTVLDAIHDRLGLKLGLALLDAGDGARERDGVPLAQDTIDTIRASDACLKAPVGESAADVIVELRQMLELYANVRPAKSYPHLQAISHNIDLVIARENTEDLYVGKEFMISDAAVAMRIITEKASKRIARYAFRLAETRRSKVTCVHKSNVMRLTDGLFARACAEVSREYPGISFENMYVDACAMNLIRQPEKFDVIVTTNLFGDILSDESAQLVGGLGMAPSANIGDDFALFEPVHGAAFDIAGKNVANPSSFLLSIKMMMEWLAGRHNDPKCLEAGRRIEDTILELVKSNIRTRDVGGTMGTQEFAAQVARRL